MSERIYVGRIGGFMIEILDGTIWISNYWDKTKIRIYIYQLDFLRTLIDSAEQKFLEKYPDAKNIK